MSSEEDKSKTWFIVLASINASIGFAHYGYTLSSFNSVQILLEKYIFPGISTTELSLLASTPNLGALFGVFFSQFISKTYGRRHTMIASDVVSFIGVILTMFHSLVPMVIGRTLTGFACGVATVIVPIYIVEISKDPLRGSLGIIPVIAGYLGQMLLFLIGLMVPSFIERQVPDMGCRILLLVPGVMNILRITNMMMFFNFETPFYLVQTKQHEIAKETLALLYHEGHSDRMDSLILERDYLYAGEEITFKDLFKPKYRMVFMVGCALSFGLQFIAVNYIMTFSNMIFSEGTQTTGNNSQPFILTTMLGVVSLIFGLIAVPLMRHYGRRTFILLGLGLSSIIELVIAIICYTDSVGNWLAKLLMIGVIAVSSLFFGSLFYLYVAETLPEVGMGVINYLNWVLAFILVQNFIHMKEALGYGTLFLISSILLAIVFSFLYKYMVETKDRSRLQVLRKYNGLPTNENSPVGSIDSFSVDPSIADNLQKVQSKEPSDSKEGMSRSKFEELRREAMSHNPEHSALKKSSTSPLASKKKEVTWKDKIMDDSDALPLIRRGTDKF